MHILGFFLVEFVYDSIFLFLIPLQKLDERKAALERANMDEGKKAKWREILVAEFMSSEESGAEDVGDHSQAVFYVKPIKWRHPTVSKFLRQMDERVEKHKSR